MCGICGFISQKTVKTEQLKKMNDSMIHRGPNDAGECKLSFSEQLEIGLAQRRLSIHDLSERGHQPFFSNDGRIVIVFNGEIYNYAELKRECSEYKFISDCDTEVVIAAYEKWGIEFVRHFNGMFAIALYDRSKAQLILSRDRIGKKPLYYYMMDGDFVFGSTLKPIMEYPFFKKELNRQAIPQYLYNRYITGKDTIFQHVFRVQPGETVIYDGREVSSEFYWKLLDSYNRCSSRAFQSFEESKKRLREELIRSVTMRLDADVPVGCFLSGGYDSSLVTAIAQSVSSKPLKTYSIGFHVKEYDEAPFAIEIAKHLGTDHTTQYVSDEEMLDLVSSIPDYYDEPFADSSQIPSMLVAQIAKQEVTVALTGDGGDELFCGYSMYDKLATAQRLEPVARILRHVIPEKSLLYTKLPFPVKSVLSNADRAYQTQFGRSFYERTIEAITGMTGEVRYDERIIPVEDWQIKRMLLDSITYLPDNNLCKVDRATMRYSLEARNPLLDVNVAETAFSIPHKYKFHRGEKKYILKQIAYEYIPKEMLDRPKKGFAVPIVQWLQGPLKEDLLAVTSEEYLRNQNIFNPEYTNRFVKDFLNNGDQGSFSGHNPSWIVWPLYMFQKWHQRYME